MDVREAVHTIIEAGNQAPSGANLQPWKFELVDADTVRIFYKWSNNDPLYDFEERGAHIGHGALLENMQIAAAHLGYRLAVTLFPDPQNSNHVSTVVVRKGEQAQEPLYDCIPKRSTNRKQYDESPLGDGVKSALTEACRDASTSVELHIADAAEEKRRLAELIMTSERLVFENRFVHDSVYSFFRWNEKEVERGDGLDVRSLEFSAPVMYMLRLFDSWLLTRLVSFTGLPVLLAKKTAVRTQSSGAICAIVAPSATPHDFVECGRAFERLWLTATNLGLSVHPIVATVLLGQRVRGSEANMFSDQQKHMISDAFNEIETIYGTKGRVITMVFRIGRAEEPTAHARRRKPEVSGT